MENNDSSSVNSLIEQLLFERKSEKDILNSRMLTMQSTNTGHTIEITKQCEHNIDENITELENLIKRLQAEIVEMSATASKPISFHDSSIAPKEKSSKSNIGSKTQEASYALPEMSNEAKEPESVNDDVLENQDELEMCSVNDSNTINEDNQKDAFNVRRDFSVLWDDTTNSSNFDVTEESIETGSIKRLIGCRYHVLEPSLENDTSMFKDVISIESLESTKSKCQIELTNASNFFESTCPNDKVFPNNTRDDDKKLSSTNKLYVDSITGGDISEIATENIMDNIPVLFNAESHSNSSVKGMSIDIKKNNIEKHSSNVVKKTDIQSSATNLLKPGTVAAIKTKIENLSISNNISAPVRNHVIPTPVTCELSQTQSVNIEEIVQTIPKTDSLLKTFNRKLREMVGLTSEKTISQDKNDSEDNFTSEKNVLKAFPKSKSEPRKDFFTSDEDSSKIGPKNTVIPLTQDKFKTSNSVYSNIKEAENSMGFMNIVKKIIPTILSSDLPDNEPTINIANDPQPANPENLVDDKPVVSVKNFNPPDIGTGTTTSGFSSMIPKFFGLDLKTDEVMKVEVEERKPVNEGNPSDDGPPDKNFLEASLKTTDNIAINIANDPQPAYPENLVDDKPVESVKNFNPPDIGTGTISSGFSSMLPNFFGSDLKTDEVMKVEVEEKKEQKEEKMEETEEADKDDIDAEKDDEDTEKGDEDDEQDDEDEEGGDDDDDTYD